jgi:hypothetical protein
MVASRLARDLRSPCTLRSLHLHDDLRVHCRRSGYPYHVRGNHRAKDRLYNSRAAGHAPLQLCAILYHPAIPCGGHGSTAPEIGVHGHSRSRELKKRLEQKSYTQAYRLLPYHEQIYV